MSSIKTDHKQWCSQCLYQEIVIIDDIWACTSIEQEKRPTMHHVEYNDIKISCGGKCHICTKIPNNHLLFAIDLWAYEGINDWIFFTIFIFQNGNDLFNDFGPLSF